MNKKILAALCALSTITHAMEQTPKPSGLVQKGDFIAFPVIHFPTNSDEEGDEQMDCQKEEAFDHFFTDLVKAASYDDIDPLSRIRKSLFMQLCVQASRRGGAHAVPFQELLAKKNNWDLQRNQFCLGDNSAVNIDFISLTKKDLSYRLLSGIPTGHTHSLVNGKTIRLLLYHYETEQDKVDNERIKAEHTARPPSPQVQWRWGMEIKPKVLPLQYSGEILKADYHFESDPEHHDRILQEFQELIK